MTQTEQISHDRETKQAGLLYQHQMRPQWGYAIFASERDDKVEYQFEDGKLRVFKKDYVHLLEEVDSFQDGFNDILESLRRRLGWKVEAPTKPAKKVAEGVLFDQQIALFQQLYPKGFQGKKWAREKRGIDTKRRLKRHREIVLVEAQKLLDPERLRLILDEGDVSSILESLRTIGDGTNLVTKAKVRNLERIDDDDARLVAERLFDLLYGEGSGAIRFERFVDTLGRAIGNRPGWQLATLYPALLKPKKHICVKPKTMRNQAAALGSSVKIASMPNAPKYDRLRNLALEVRRRLVDAGLRPRDLVDVFDFMETTLAPKALKQIRAMKTDRRASDTGERTAA